MFAKIKKGVFTLEKFEVRNLIKILKLLPPDMDVYTKWGKTSCAMYLEALKQVNKRR